MCSSFLSIELLYLFEIAESEYTHSHIFGYFLIGMTGFILKLDIFFIHAISILIILGQNNTDL